MFSVLAAAAFSPRTRETPDLLNCSKKLFSLDKRLPSSYQKRQKLVVCRKVLLKCQGHTVQAIGYLKASNDRASQDL